MRTQAPSSLLFYGEGWHRPEDVTPISAGSRWTSSRASLSFRNPREDCVLYLRIAGRPDLFDGPQQVTVVAHGRGVRSFPVNSQQTGDYEVALSAGDLGLDEDATITLVDKTFVPSQVPGSTSSDRRELGILVYHAFLEPKSDQR